MPKKRDAYIPRRLKYMLVSAAVFVSMCKDGERFECIVGLPKDATFFGAWYEYARNELRVIVESDSYPLLMEGEQMQEIFPLPQFRALEAHNGKTETQASVPTAAYPSGEGAEPEGAEPAVGPGAGEEV